MVKHKGLDKETFVRACWVTLIILCICLVFFFAGVSFVKKEFDYCKDKFYECRDLYNNNCISNPTLSYNQPFNITFGVSG